MGKELVVEENLHIEDGKHFGQIVKVEYKGPEEELHSQFDYTDIHIKEKETGIILRTGVPTNLTPNSSLGKLLAKFLGRALVLKEKIVPEVILLDKEVTFLTMMKKTERGEFARILPESITPVVITETIETEEKPEKEKKNEA